MKICCTDITLDAVMYGFPFHIKAACTDFRAQALSYGILSSHKGARCAPCIWEDVLEPRARSSAQTPEIYSI